MSSRLISFSVFLTFSPFAAIINYANCLQRSRIEHIYAVRFITRFNISFEVPVSYFWWVEWQKVLHHYSAADRGAEYCDERVCLCMCVCLSAIISSELQVRSSPNLLCMLPMTVAWSSSSGKVICYVLPVLWMTSCLLISQGCSTSLPSWSAVHMQPWAWL